MHKPFTSIAFTPIALTHPCGDSASIYPHGAHLRSWKTADGKERIFVSEKARLQEGKAIRGGVPIIFPQFNERGNTVRHGFARHVCWRPLTLETLQDGSVKSSYELLDNVETQKLWPFSFRALYNVVLSKGRLEMSLSIQNTSDEVFEFTCALHSYFNVSDIAHVSLQGLEGLLYWDNDGSDFNQRHEAKARDLNFDSHFGSNWADAKSFDRVYFDVTKALKLCSENSVMTIEQTGFRDTVVWNPGAQATANFSDMLVSEARNMLCVEAAVVDRPISLAAGECWEGSQILSVL